MTEGRAPARVTVVDLLDFTRSVDTTGVTLMIVPPVLTTNTGALPAAT